MVILVIGWRLLLWSEQHANLKVMELFPGCPTVDGYELFRRVFAHGSSNGQRRAHLTCTVPVAETETEGGGRAEMIGKWEAKEKKNTVLVKNMIK